MPFAHLNHHSSLLIRQPPKSTLFPTRRSSDLVASEGGDGEDRLLPAARGDGGAADGGLGGGCGEGGCGGEREEDRKSTRLNSSHVEISYAVFCLKKKNV